MNSSQQTCTIPGISPEHTTSLRNIFRLFPEIDSVVLYGSRAKQNHRHNSDIDLCLKNTCISLSRLLELEGQIDDLLLPWMFDIAVYNSIKNPALREHIDRIGKVIYP